MRLKKLFPIAIVLALVALGSNSHATLMMESAEFSKNVQDQIQKHLDHIFGSKKSEVFVFVELDYPEDVKKKLSQNLDVLLSKEAQYLAELNKPRPKESASPYSVSLASPTVNWMLPGAWDPSKQERLAYILPGFKAPNQTGYVPDNIPTQSAGLQSPTSALPFGDANFMQSLAVNIKRSFIKILLDKSLPPDAEEKVQVIIGMMFNLNPERGDRMVIDRVKIYHPMAELFRDIGFLGSTVTGLAIIFVGSLALIMVFFALMILRNYLRERATYSPEVFRSNTEARHPGLSAPGAGTTALPMMEEYFARGGLPMGNASKSLALRADEPSDTIKVAPEQLGGLFQLIGNEEPSRIALVIARLEPNCRMDFLKFFEGTHLAQILEALSQPQFVDPDAITQLKKKLEHRLSGFFGGEEEVLRILETSSIEAKDALLKAIEEKTPDFYRQIRSKVLVFEDLKKFDDTNFIKILSRIPLEKISWLIGNGIEDDLRQKIMKCLPKKTQETIGQLSSMAGQIPKQRVQQTKEELLSLAGRMVKEGMIARPNIEVSETEAVEVINPDLNLENNSEISVPEEIGETKEKTKNG